MNLLSWNCRGLGNPRTVRILGDVVTSLKPVFLFLAETKVDSGKIEELCVKYGFAKCFAVNIVGQGGGLAVMWKSNLECEVQDSSNNHIDVTFFEKSIPSWRLSCFYGMPERDKRHESWDLLRQLAVKYTMPWCVFGDFNDLLYATDKKGVHPHPQACLEGFRLAVEDCNLVELDLVGGEFTWEKSKGKSTWVRERLDRAFAVNEWWHKFPLCTLKVIHTTCSDHDPIQLSLFDTTVSRKQFRFRFENSWLKEPAFKEEMANVWKSLPTMNILPKLMSMSSHMSKWGRRFFHKFRDKVRVQKEEVSKYLHREDEEGIKLYFEEREKLNELLLHEEVYWKQRAKLFWLKEGDLNTKFFHAQATKRKKINNIAYLVNEDDEKIDDLDQMCVMAKDYFEGIFTEWGNVSVPTGSAEQPVITMQQNKEMVADLSFEEFTIALKQMHPEKAVGPDGFNPAFFQHFWDVVGKEVYNCCKTWLNENAFPTELNSTNLVLIPKKEKVEKLSDVRPIALCNVLYKILAKVLANRLKSVLPFAISENQSAFVPGRSITDNVLIAFEMIHFMKKKKGCQDGEVALKLDISKAYDRVC